MMRLYLIRHGMTFGNTLGRYIGTTDEPLTEDGRAALEQLSYPGTELLFASPLLRCRETAGILFPEMKPEIVKGFAECDFGAFENKNYKELDGNGDYQRWIDSNGTLPFPGGESPEAFRKRCVEAFDAVMDICREKKAGSAACVVHGGTIMSILAEYAVPGEEFYHWQVRNGEGYVCTVDLTQWGNGNREIKVQGRI